MAETLNNNDVFINCPFDDRYKPMFNALVFAIYELGFIARCAREADDSGEVRLAKIERIIRQCKYGIHDISEVTLDAVNHLPRFNMPLELGMFFGNGDTHWVSDWPGWRRVRQTGYRQRISGQIRRKSMSVPRFAASRRRQKLASPVSPRIKSSYLTLPGMTFAHMGDGQTRQLSLSETGWRPPPRGPIFLEEQRWPPGTSDSVRNFHACAKKRT